MRLRKLSFALAAVSVSLGLSAAEPKFAWRGFMLDEARHFFGKEVVKSYLDRMAALKLNVFHWHLADDQGWRLDLPGMPELVKYGAARPSSPTPGMNDDSDNTPYGPFFYTVDDVKEVLAHADKLGIRVVPEIEIPGHMRAFLAAHPEFACRPDAFPRTAWCHWGITEDVICAGNDAALAFYERVLDEVMKIFPGEFIHIGGDECPKTRWKACPKCQARMKAEGLKDEAALQGWITRRIVNYVASKGRRAIGWDEILEGGDLPKGTVVQSWRGAEGGLAAAKAGYDVIMSPCEWTYFTFAEGVPNDPYKYRTWVRGKTLPASKMRAFNPVEGIPAELRHHVLGGECCAWSETFYSLKELEFKTLHRIGSFAAALHDGPVEVTDVKQGRIRAGAVFGHDMVLQRDAELSVFGSAVPGVLVTVAFGGKSATARADGAGQWCAKLPAFPASAEGRTLKIADAIAFTNVVVGDVWALAGIQCFNQAVTDPSGKGMKQYLDEKGPCAQVRVCGGGCYNSMLPAPSDRIAWQKWQPATKQGCSGHNAPNCAAAYVFGRELFDATGVPQGVIRLDWVWENEISSFLPDEAFALEPELSSLCGVAARDRAKLADWLRTVSATGVLTPAPVPLSRVSTTGSAWNAMANGIAGFAVRGAVWGQGDESLIDEKAETYRAKLRALVRSWRMRWNANLPFALVRQNERSQKNPCAVPCGRVLAEMRAAQEAVAATEGLGVTAISADNPSWSEDLLGRELAKWALGTALKTAPMQPLAEKPARKPEPAADPELSVLEVFTSHMVLQRGKPVPVTGKARPGAEVKVTFAGQTVKAKADAKGCWTATLAPMSASSEPRTLTVTSQPLNLSTSQLTFTDVLVGDVWLVSGQSNAELPMRSASGWPEAFAEAEKFPNVRMAKFRRVVSSMPVGGRATNREWVRCTAETLPILSSVGYHFAKDINARTGVPIGILDDNWGGRTIQTFLDGDYVRTLDDPEIKDHIAASKGPFAQNAAAGAAELDRGVASSIWFDVKGSLPFGSAHNAMIAPVTGFPITGALWYQGCSNCNDSDARYGAMLKALIGGWRAKWGADLPVYVVQLQSNGGKTTDAAGGDGYANVRNAQFRITRELPRCGLAVCADIGLTIHPGNKPDLAKRLALWARRDVYGEKDLVVAGPTPRKLTREGNKIRIAFDYVGSGLMAAENPSPNTVGSKSVPTPGGKLKGFSIAGKDGKWAFADATIDGETVVLSSPDVSEPTSVRYGHRGFPYGMFNLYNKEGLPAPMFALEAE